MTTSQYCHIRVERNDDGVGLVTLDRPAALNSLSGALVLEMEQALDELEAAEEVRCVVVTGAGSRAFSAGADLREMAGLSPNELETRAGSINSQIWRLANLRQPTIGAINGLAYGAGALLASALDLRVGCDRSQFCYLAVRNGYVNSTWTLPMVVGWSHAKDLLYTGRLVEAEEAAKLGLLNRLVPNDHLLDAALAMAREISANSGPAVQHAKRLLHGGLGSSWQDMQRADIASAELVPLTPVRESFPAFFARGDDRGGM
jgi:enoyl-CoA hydratase/carnithine racemase